MNTETWHPSYFFLNLLRIFIFKKSLVTLFCKIHIYIFHNSNNLEPLSFYPRLKQRKYIYFQLNWPVYQYFEIN